MPDRPSMTDRHGLGIATVMARKGVDAAAIAAALGVDVPRGPRASFSDARIVLGTGPGVWLVVADDAAMDFAELLAEPLTGLASVSDQSSAYVVQRLAGSYARTVLQRGVAIDLDSETFRAGSVASTAIAHIGVILWQLDDQPTYDVAIPRSYAGSFRHWFDQAIAAL